MTTTRKASAIWDGNLIEGKGTVSLVSSGVGTFNVSWPARNQEPNGQTSPEELLGAAHAACFSMALSSRRRVSQSELSSESSVEGCSNKTRRRIGQNLGPRYH